MKRGMRNAARMAREWRAISFRGPAPGVMTTLLSIHKKYPTVRAGATIAIAKK